MPSTRSSAATKCISEVPGLVKQTSTPPATRVRTRLSAPFIRSAPFAVQRLDLYQDQSFLAPSVKGGFPAYLPSQAIARAILTAPFEIRHVRLRKYPRYGLLSYQA